jgi:heme/copper-type cytochrome/quinol oxidase subunit 4
VSDHSTEHSAQETKKVEGAGYKKDWRYGWIIFIALLVLTLVEYFLGIQENASTVALFIVALIKAALIVYFFMHIYRLWREENH